MKGFVEIRDAKENLRLINVNYIFSIEVKDESSCRVSIAVKGHTTPFLHIDTKESYPEIKQKIKLAI